MLTIVEFGSKGDTDLPLSLHSGPVILLSTKPRRYPLHHREKTPAKCSIAADRPSPSEPAKDATRAKLSRKGRAAHGNSAERWQ